MSSYQMEVENPECDEEAGMAMNNEVDFDFTM